MSGDRQPRPGDRVRFTVEGVVTDLDDHECVAMVKADGEQRAHYVPRGADVEVLEPADDPSAELVGAVRPGSREGTSFVKVNDNKWVCVGDTSTGKVFGDDHMRDYPAAVGSVPGTPAAEPLPPQELIREDYEKRQKPEVVDASTLFPPPVGTAPRVFTSDGPEPPEDVTILEKVDYPENRGFPFTKRGAYGWTNCETPDADTSNVHGFKWPPGYDMTFREVTA